LTTAATNRHTLWRGNLAGGLAEGFAILANFTRAPCAALHQGARVGNAVGIETNLPKSTIDIRAGIVDANAVVADPRRAHNIRTGIGDAQPLRPAAFAGGAVFVIAVDDAIALNAAAAIARTIARAIHANTWIRYALIVIANLTTRTADDVAVVAVSKGARFVALAGDIRAQVDARIANTALVGRTRRTGAWHAEHAICWRLTVKANGARELAARTR
jgi:hypothetical protein